jgi:antitoxin component YwqK of YwqJK toxin-antitoxin module
MSLKQANNSDLLLVVKNYVLKKYTLKTPKYEFYIEPSYLNIDGKFAMLSATPLYEDGSNISTEYFEDIVFVLCLEKKEGKWEIIYDLSRNDVPSFKEMKEIKKDFPKDFPKKLLPDFWRKKFSTIWINIEDKNPNVVFEEDGKVYVQNSLLKDGNYELIMDDDFIWTRFTIKNGKLSGKYEEYFDESTLSSIGFYKNGKPEGESKNFYDSGEVWFVQHYKNGKLLNQITYDKDGKVIVKN